MSETSSRVRLMANLQAAVAEAVSGTMEERGRFRRALAGVRAELPYSRRGMGANVRPRKNRRYQRGGLNVNCHGCKWLDRYKKDGNGYCCMVERSKTQREKVRRPDMERCELYKPGDFNTRYRTEVNE